MEGAISASVFVKEDTLTSTGMEGAVDLEPAAKSVPGHPQPLSDLLAWAEDQLVASAQRWCAACSLSTTDSAEKAWLRRVRLMLTKALRPYAASSHQALRRSARPLFQGRKG